MIEKLKAEVQRELMNIYEHSMALEVDEASISDGLVIVEVWQNRYGTRGALVRGKTTESDKTRRSRVMGDQSCYSCTANIMLAHVIEKGDGFALDVKQWATFHEKAINRYDLCDDCARVEAIQILERAVSELAGVGWKLRNVDIEVIDRT